MAGIQNRDEIHLEKRSVNMEVDTAPSSPGDSVIRDGRKNDEHFRLGWKTWLVVFITCFGYSPFNSLIDLELF